MFLKPLPRRGAMTLEAAVVYPVVIFLFLILIVGGMAVSGAPAWLPAPPQATVPSTAPAASDPTAQGQLNAQLPAFFQDLQCDGGRRHRQREPDDDGSAPVDQPSYIAERPDGERGERQLGGTEAEYGASHRQEPAEFEFESDQE